MMHARFRSIKTFLVVVSVSIASFHAHAREPNADLYGKWKIKGFAGASIVSGLSDRQVRRLIGKPMAISAEKFSFNGKTCKRPTYKRSVEETVSYFDREWRADSSELPLPNPVTVIETECNMLYLIRENRIIVAEDGNFFEAVRVGK